MQMSCTDFSHLCLLDLNRIVAPPHQYGLIGTEAILQCTTTFETTNSVSFEWKHNGQPLSSEVIEDVQLVDEGMYICEVILWSFSGRKVKKEVNFSMIGESNNLYNVFTYVSQIYLYQSVPVKLVHKFHNFLLIYNQN